MSDFKYELEYNTGRKRLVISEYGRNIQKMIDFLVTIEDRNKRTEFAKLIVKIMGRVTVQDQDVRLYQNKLWDHLYLMSSVDLDIDYPYGKPSLQDIMSKPEKLAYPSNRIKYKMYGANIQHMIKTVVLMDEGPEKDEIILVIANAMKRAYMAWNKSAVQDEVIFGHLLDLSKGLIELDSSKVKLKAMYDILANQNKKTTNSKNSKKSSKKSKNKNKQKRK